MADIKEVHNLQHKRPVNDTDILFGNDGVAESNSTQVSLDIFTVKFVDCRQTYIPAIYRETPKGKVIMKKPRNKKLYKYWALKKVLQLLDQ